MTVVERLGTMEVTVGLGPDGKLRATFVTKLQPHLAEMQGALSEQELQVARALLGQVLNATAEFMAFLYDPDQPVEFA